MFVLTSVASDSFLPREASRPIQTSYVLDANETRRPLAELFQLVSSNGLHAPNSPISKSY